jgi:hypothetical protein
LAVVGSVFSRLLLLEEERVVEEVVQLTALYAADTDEEEEGQEDNNTADHAMEEVTRNCKINSKIAKIFATN